MSMSKAFIQGVLTADPSMKYTPSGMEVVEFSVATEKKKKGEKHSSFWNITAFGKRGQVIMEHFQKGKAINLVCEMEQQRWEKDGRKHSKVAYIMDDFTFNSAGRRDDAPANEYDQTAGPAEDVSQEPPAVDEENLPF